METWKEFRKTLELTEEQEKEILREKALAMAGARKGRARQRKHGKGRGAEEAKE